MLTVRVGMPFVVQVRHVKRCFEQIYVRELIINYDPKICRAVLRPFSRPRSGDGTGQGRNISYAPAAVWGSSRDQIPQPTSILLGRNLRRNSDAASKKQKDEPKEKEPPQKSNLRFGVDHGTVQRISRRRAAVL